jgi:hypothetical protein
LSWRRPAGEYYGREATRHLSASKVDTTDFSKKSSTESLFSGDFHNTIAGSEAALGLNEYMRQFAINGVIEEQACYDQSGYSAIAAPYTHGTHIMDVATGYPNPLPVKNIKDDKPKEDIVFVQLPRFFGGSQVFGLLKTHVLDAVRYIFLRTNPRGALTINLSYGSNCGPHNGDSILELALDEMIELRRGIKTKDGEVQTNIVIPAGNSFARNTHAYCSVSAQGESTIGWSNTPDNPTYQFIEVWIDDDSDLETKVQLSFAKSLKDEDWVEKNQIYELEHLGVTIATVISQKVVPQSTKGRMILIAIEPTVNASHYGQWHIKLRAGSNKIRVNAWCERDDPIFGSNSTPRQGEFTTHIAKDYTLNSIAHGRNTTVVGGQNPNGKVADYSSDSSMREARVDERGDIKDRAPLVYALSEEAESQTGLSAAGVYGDTVIRLPGTSVATAVATRYISQNADFRSKLVDQASIKVKTNNDSRVPVVVSIRARNLPESPNPIMQQEVGAELNRKEEERTGTGRNSIEAQVIPFDLTAERIA